MPYVGEIYVAHHSDVVAVAPHWLVEDESHLLSVGRVRVIYSPYLSAEQQGSYTHGNRRVDGQRRGHE